VFTEANRQRAVAFIRHVQAGRRAASREQFLLTAMRIAAFADNAHDQVDFGAGWRPASRLPLHLIWFADAMLIARAAPEHEDLLGARIERIEGLRPSELAERLRPYCGGTAAYLRWNRTWVIESAGLLHALGIARSPDRLRLTLVLVDGRRVERSVSFVPRSEVPLAPPPRLWSARPTDAEQGRGWHSVHFDLGEPLYLQQPDEPFRMLPMPEAQALYVQFRANSTADAMGVPIAPFVERVRQALENEAPHNLILDLRFDIGGDIDQTRELARVMAASVPGRIYVLIGPYTFSAGIVFAAAVKHDARERAVVVGDEVGDRLQWWSEAEHACMPNSAYCFHASSGYWDLQHGCSGKPGCYGDAYEARVQSLRPDIRAPLTAADWVAGRDAGMQALMAALAAQTAAERTNVGR
jgi:hypothetical protein